MVFWRTYNNKVYPLGDVTQLGFTTSDPSYIPDEYLESKNFVILRTCFGVGDWGIISAFPRKLKEKYPDCKVWVPSSKLLREMFGHLEQNWSSWADPFEVVHTIFDNNPYIDGFVDSFEGEVFNDHYRIYDDIGIYQIPLMEEILKFWQFDNFDDIEPELYFSKEEIELGDQIIKEHCDGEFGTLLISNRFDGVGVEKIQQKIDEYDLPMFYWTKSTDVGLDFKKALDMRHIDTRIQLYIKTKAMFNVGNQTGMNDTIANYASTFTVPRGKLGSNFIRSQYYLVDMIHEYKYVKMDIENAIKLGTKYIAFDDYGLFPEIKQAIDEYVVDGRLELVSHIGYPIGTHFHMSLSTNTTPDKILVDSEGVICRVI
jgi:hypothetical protein